MLEMNRRNLLTTLGAGAIAGKLSPALAQAGKMQSWKLATSRTTGIHDLAPAPDGGIWFTAQASGHLDTKTGDSTVVEPPTRNQGARRVWSDSKGRIWVSEWNSGNLSMHDPQATGSNSWRSWKLPGDRPQVYAVYVDQRDIVWVSEWSSNATYSFDARTEKFERYAMPRDSANVRQILGRAGEVWLPESGTEHISVIRTA